MKEEAAYQIQATEIKHGIALDNQVERQRNGRNPRSFFGHGSGRKNQKCHTCTGNHPLWKCEAFRKLSSDERWQTAKQFGLCFRCLEDNHHGKSCTRSKQCNIKGCKGNHHHLLHYDKIPPVQSRLRREAEPYVNRPTTPFQTQNTVSERSEVTMEGNGAQRSVTLETYQEHEQQQGVALRTVPIILKNGSRRVLVNCLLDEGSDTTYVNEDVVEELGLGSKKQQITVKVANDQSIRFFSGLVKIGLESTDGRVDTEITAKTSDRICGGLKAVNWVKIQDKWDHLRGIPFPKLARGNQVDVLLGADHFELMYSMKEINGRLNGPCATLCPLGWTAVGRIKEPDEKRHYTGFHHTFRLHIDQERRVVTENDNSELNSLVKRFWDLESIGIMTTEPQLTPEDKLTWNKVSKSLKFDGDHYEVAVPCREDRPQWPDNLPMAKKRLVSTERRLLKDKEVSVAYQNVLNDCLEKGYIRRVPPNEPKPECQWFLAHFPVVRPEKATTKVRIVFDGSAPFEGKSLNTSSDQPQAPKRCIRYPRQVQKRVGSSCRRHQAKCTTSLYYEKKIDPYIVSCGVIWIFARSQ